MDDKDKKFGEELVQNVGEIRAEEEYGAKIEDKVEKLQEIEMTGQEFPTEGERKQRISEEEAKRLIAEEARKTEANLQNLHSDKHKKTIIAVVIVAVVLCIGMLIAALMLGNRDKGEMSENGGNSQIEKPGEGRKKRMG